MELLESGQMYKHALERLKQWGVIEKDVEQETGEAYLRSYIKGYMARIKAHGNYEAKIYPGRITLFRAEPEPKQAYGWSCLSTEPLSIREIAGPHWRIMKEPQVQVLAHQLRECLDSIDCQEELDSQVEYA
jgi:thioesterase domain-containing protein